MRDVLRNMLAYGDLPFRDFVELALYHPQFGYYARPQNPVGRGGDYVTAPVLSPVFAFAISRLVHEFVSRSEGALCSFVDIGCGDGSLVRTVADEKARFFGVDRSLERIQNADNVSFVRTFDEVSKDGAQLVFSNELYDAFPFARLVNRGEHLHELWVAEREGVFDWVEHEAPAAYDDYFAERGIELAEGQFADVSLEWGAYYADVVRRIERGLVVTIDYGYPQAKLFHPRARRFGTAAAYAGQRVSRDLLANPGEQDLTAHINFTDLERAGEREGAKTLYFDSLAKFLLALGAAEHELLRPAEITSLEERERREDAKRLVLPDGIGIEMKVLVQSKSLEGEWSFQQKLF